MVCLCRLSRHSKEVQTWYYVFTGFLCVEGMSPISRMPRHRFRSEIPTLCRSFKDFRVERRSILMSPILKDASRCCSLILLAKSRIGIREMGLYHEFGFVGFVELTLSVDCIRDGLFNLYDLHFPVTYNNCNSTPPSLPQLQATLFLHRRCYYSKAQHSEPSISTLLGKAILGLVRV